MLLAFIQLLLGGPFFSSHPVSIFYQEEFFKIETTFSSGKHTPNIRSRQEVQLAVVYWDSRSIGNVRQRPLVQRRGNWPWEASPMSLSAFHPLLYLDPLPLPLRYAVDFNTQKNTFTFGGILDMFFDSFCNHFPKANCELLNKNRISFWLFFLPCLENFFRLIWVLLKLLKTYLLK